MIYDELSNTGIKVSKICLGTMTWGEQNTEADGHEQMDYALDQGINFFDTAEMYSVPGREETQGSTEKIIGSWFAKTGNRDKIVLASKAVGPNKGLSYIRGGRVANYSKEDLHTAINGSLKRLQTDYVDLYQLHWPERKTNFFGKLNYKHDPNDEWKDNFLEIIETLNGLIKEGKIKHYGLSNETAWGAMHFLKEADMNNLPRLVSVQNPYSLLNRSYEIGLAEVGMRENVGLLAYSPLGMGALTGKYLDGKQPADARLTLYKAFSRYNSPLVAEAVAKFDELAKASGISVTQLALAFINQQPFLTSNIIGATTMEQLKENISSVDVTLSDDVLDEIEKINHQYSNIAP